MIKTLVLGAGHEVGKSCVVVTIGGKTIMFDCGMHMGYHDDRRFPDFSLIPKQGDFTQSIDCIIITHFHLDHVGALPYFTEVCGYEGPIFMTYPTKALAPLMLEDYRKVMVERRGQQEQFSVLQIHECMRKVTAVDLRQTITLGPDFQLRAYYAGHVLGAAMFYVKVGESTVVYTGDYNMTPDKHLGAAQIDRLLPDLVITESTYATTIKDSKHARERDFLKAVHKCVSAGGKVLIPVFALGRAQELCILLDDYWERMNLKAPIYFSAGLTIQANVYYKLFIAWTSQKVKDTCVTRNTFDFKHVSVFNRSQTNAPGPCVLFATPGMLSGGLSLEVFKQWAPFEQNMVVVPGYCVPGTVGHKLTPGKFVRLDLDKRTQLEVRCQVHHLSFSAHTDAKGIMDLLRHVGPKHVILVHGERPKMALLKTRIISELGIPCFDPSNGEVVKVPLRLVIKVLASEQFLAGTQPRSTQEIVTNEPGCTDVFQDFFKDTPAAAKNSIHSGIIMMNQHKSIQVLHPQEALDALNVSQHRLLYKCYCPVYMTSSKGRDITVAEKSVSSLAEEGEISEELDKPSKKHRRGMQSVSSLDRQHELKDNRAEENSVRDPKDLDEKTVAFSLEPADVLHAVCMWLNRGLSSTIFTKQEDCIIGRSLCIRISDEHSKVREAQMGKIACALLVCTWSAEDEKLANEVVSLIRTIQLSPRETT
eukprot:c5259_g1_i1 orf=104-2215(+)